MQTSIILDLLIVAGIALSIFFGWKNGMVHGLLTLAGMILAIIVASEIGDVASGWIIEEVIRPAAHTAIEQRILELDPKDFFISPLEDLTRVIDAIEFDLVREKAHELLSTVNLPTEPLYGSAQETLLSISSNVVDTVLRGPVKDVISAIICTLCFALFSIALRPVIWMIEQAFKLPLLRQINQIGGLISGAARGILLVLIAVWVLRLTGWYVTDEVIAQSHLLKLAVQCLAGMGLGISATV